MVDWSKPLEHVDGTPLVLEGDASQYPNGWGNYYVVREDGEQFTGKQLVNTPLTHDKLIVCLDGTAWSASGSTGIPVVRNRIPQFTATVRGRPLTRRMVDARITGVVALDTGWRATFEDGRIETIGPKMMEWLMHSDGGGDALDDAADTIDERMTRLIRAVADDRGNPLSGEAAAIVADLPADPLLVRAREIAAVEMERAGHVRARNVRSGERDDDPAVRAVLVALRERDV